MGNLLSSKVSLCDFFIWFIVFTFCFFCYQNRSASFKKYISTQQNSLACLSMSWLLNCRNLQHSWNIASMPPPWNCLKQLGVRDFPALAHVHWALTSLPKAALVLAGLNFFALLSLAFSSFTSRSCVSSLTFGRLGCDGSEATHWNSSTPPGEPPQFSSFTFFGGAGLSSSLSTVMSSFTGIATQNH